MELTTQRRRKPTMELADARKSGFYNIGQAAEATGVSAKTPVRITAVSR